jgi:DNA-binding transcriptional MerR regulator
LGRFLTDRELDFQLKEIRPILSLHSESGER